MKKPKFNNLNSARKNVIEKHKNYIFINSGRDMDERSKRRHQSIEPPVDTSMLSREKRRSPTTDSRVIQRTHIKKDVVDYDVVICIPSYNRYDKIKRLIGQFYEQETKYTFKIILLNDGSSGLQYDELHRTFPDIVYLKNNTSNGKNKHWLCYGQLWKEIKNIECHVVLQMDDDFILSNNFLNIIIDLFFEMKEKDGNIMAIHPHLWANERESDFQKWWTVYDHFVDGIALIDDYVIKYMNYKMKPVELNKLFDGSSAYAWSQIGEAIKQLNGMVYRTENSLVYHDGNEDSKLHPDHRKKLNGKVYTQRYIEEL